MTLLADLHGIATSDIRYEDNNTRPCQNYGSLSTYPYVRMPFVSLECTMCWWAHSWVLVSGSNISKFMTYSLSSDSHLTLKIDVPFFFFFFGRMNWHYMFSLQEETNNKKIRGKQILKFNGNALLNEVCLRWRTWLPLACHMGTELKWDTPLPGLVFWDSHSHLCTERL